VCGTSCPSGQSLSGSGRCVPSTLMVQNERGGERTQHAALDSATADEEPDRSFEPTSTTWTPVVKTNPARRVPLEGRMAIGGPVPAPDAAPALETGSLQRPSLERTAAIEPQDVPIVDLPPAPAMPEVRATSFDSNAVIDRPARATASRPKAPSRAVQRRSTSNYRHVQRLFQHPLGSL